MKYTVIACCAIALSAVISGVGNAAVQRDNPQPIEHLQGRYLCQMRLPPMPVVRVDGAQTLNPGEFKFWQDKPVLNPSMPKHQKFILIASSASQYCLGSMF